MTCSDLYIWY